MMCNDNSFWFSFFIKLEVKVKINLINARQNVFLLGTLTVRMYPYTKC